jgi:hypothetical protein
MHNNYLSNIKIDWKSLTYRALNSQLNEDFTAAIYELLEEVYAKLDQVNFII